MCNHCHEKKKSNGQKKRDDSPTGATRKITGTKLYVPVVTLSTAKFKITDAKVYVPIVTASIKYIVNLTK